MVDKRITTYEAEYKNMYSGRDLFGKADVTSVRKIAQLVDGQWYHSLHWPKTIGLEWRDEVRKSLDSEMVDALNRVDELRLAQKILDSIDFEGGEQDN